MSRQHRSRVIVEVPGSPALYQSSPLPGWDVVGTVTTGEGRGALVHNRITGIYCQANAGSIRSLPQSKVKAALVTQPENPA